MTAIPADPPPSEKAHDIALRLSFEIGFVLAIRTRNPGSDLPAELNEMTEKVASEIRSHTYADERYEFINEAIRLGVPLTDQQILDCQKCFSSMESREVIDHDLLTRLSQHADYFSATATRYMAISFAESQDGVRTEATDNELPERQREVLGDFATADEIAEYLNENAEPVRKRLERLAKRSPHILAAIESDHRRRSDPACLYRSTEVLLLLRPAASANRPRKK